MMYDMLKKLDNTLWAVCILSFPIAIATALLFYLLAKHTDDPLDNFRFNDVHAKFLNEVKYDSDFDVFFESAIFRNMTVQEAVERNIAKLYLNKNAGQANMALRMKFNAPFGGINTHIIPSELYQCNILNTSSAIASGYTYTCAPNIGYMSNNSTDIQISPNDLRNIIKNFYTERNRDPSAILQQIDIFLNKCHFDVVTQKETENANS